MTLTADINTASDLYRKAARAAANINGTTEVEELRRYVARNLLLNNGFYSRIFRGRTVWVRRGEKGTVSWRGDIATLDIN